MEPILDFCSRCREPFPRSRDEPVAAADTVFEGGEAPGTERGSVGAVFKEFDDEFEAIKVDQLLFGELAAELVTKDFSIRVADTEGDQGSDVAEDGLPDGQGKLVDVLVGQGQAKPVFAGFGEDGGEGVGAEVLELVDEEVKVASRFQIGRAHV